MSDKSEEFKAGERAERERIVAFLQREAARCLSKASAALISAVQSKIERGDHDV